MNPLSVTIIQARLHWENPSANRLNFSEKIEGISENTDLVILPEMFTTGFSMQATALAEESQGETLNWMVSEAKKHSIAITGSIIVRENGLFYNRLYFVFPNGDFKHYDKRHTFTLAGEHLTYTAGKEQLIVDYKGWKIFPLICYDLRFPVWARNSQEYDLVLYVANWPVKRITAWDALLKARAIENMAYCVGVNRIGLDGNGYEYCGHSAVFDVLGEQISTKDFEKDFVETVSLSKDYLNNQREKLQFLKDRDSYQINF
ncbi:MAG: omega-amidase [Sediminicola sp.]|jgi:predicted amidohydrolase|tara:strand:- start:130 stop:909 length:780 start_codon:yes stop_codon:yes gene_type:complete